MTSLPRRFWFAAVCTLALFVSATAAQAQAIKLLPNDTELIVTVNLQQILKSEVVKANQAILDLVKAKITEKLEEKGVDKHLNKAGFDLYKDLTSITVAIPGGRDSGEGFIVLEGNFDADKIEAAAIEVNKDAGNNLKIIKIANVKAFEVAPKDEKTMYVGILNANTLIACASKADFAEAVARLNGTKSASFKADAIKPLLQTVNNKQSISIVATSNVIEKLSANNPNAGGDQAKVALIVLKQMEGFSAGITIEKNIDFQVGVNTKDKDTASKFAAFSDKFIQDARGKVAKLAAQNEKLEPAVAVLQTLRAAAQGNNLMITGQVTFETLEKLLSNLPLGN